MKSLGIFLGTALVGSVLVFGCGDLPGTRVVLPVDGAEGTGLGSLVDGVGIGEECSSEEGQQCRTGLECENGACIAGMSQALGERCFIGPECEEGLQCSVPPSCDQSNPISCIPSCVTAGDGQVGDACQLDLECEAGLRCGLNGFSSECMTAGHGDIGAECTLQQDCYQGLYCSNSECSLPEPPIGVALWDGVSCGEQDEDNVEALFNVPGAKDTPEGADFFSLPYPNDIRLTEAGRPDLSGFPTPGNGLLDVDIVQAYVDAIEEKSEGWSTNPTFVFRFTGGLDLDSLSAKEPGLGARAPVVVVDVDSLPDAPENGYRTLGTQYATGSGSSYVCDDWFAMRLPNQTLKPNHRYVAWLTTQARSQKGDPISRSAQFDKMLDADPPSGDSSLAAAHAAYSPLREYLAFYEGSENEIDADTILTAVVFTTGDPNAEMRLLADGVQAADTPTASDWVKCGGAAVSPCEQADEAEGRACGEGTSDYDEYQALVELPIFQKGEAPYLKSGGDLASSPVRTEKVCVSMSIPTEAMPASGWPLVIYGHGTGGSYRGAIRDSVAGELSRATPRFATLGFDEVQHGPRRGSGEGSDQSPDNLFFNFLNPDAARGNPLQGAADILSLLKFAKTGSLASAEETGGVAIEVDPTKVFVFGHSQGSTHGSIALPFSSMPGAVFSGNGGGMVEALMNKTNPVNIAAAIPYAIQDVSGDGSLRMGDRHPVLSLLQHYIDPADPVNFAPLLALRPEPGMAPKSVFQTFGLDDTYSPPKTMARYVHAAQLMSLAEPPSGVNAQGDNDLGLKEAASVSGNVTIDPDTATLVCRQYEAKNSSDGHFVVHDVAEANADAIGFLSALGGGQTPTVPLP